MNFKFQISNFKKGFTLIELLVVLAIIGILAAFLMANFVGIKGRARDAQRKSDLAQISSAAEFYRSDNGFYPPAASLSSCGGALTDGSSRTYIQKIPCDPTDGITAYQYVRPSNGVFCVRACLENGNDSQIDNTVPSQCSGASVCANTYWKTNP